METLLEYLEQIKAKLELDYDQINAGMTSNALIDESGHKLDMIEARLETLNDILTFIKDTR